MPVRGVGGPAAGPGRGRAWPLLALAAWLLALLGVRPLLLPDEGRYVEVAWEMLHGDAAVPTLYGLPFFHKPPLFYWIAAASMKLLGPMPFAARLGSALGGWVIGAALLLDLRRHVPQARAASALALLATSPFFFVAAQYANHDMLVAGWITAAVVCARIALDGAPRRWPWLLAAWAAAALAVLSKGLIGVVVPALVLVPWLAWQRRWRDIARLLHPGALALFALLALPWFVAMATRFPGFLDYFVIEQHFRRYATAGFNNAQPFWFFLVALPLLMLPWSAWLVPALRALAPAWRQRNEGSPVAATTLFYAWWVLAVLLFFSLPQSKLPGYVLPALAPFAGLLALAARPGRAWRISLASAVVVCMGTVLALAWRAPGSHQDVARELRRQLRPGDRVALVDQAFFDLPFYARLGAAPAVLADWDDPALATRDDWRKELHDAARFDPAAGRAVLWPWARADELACGVAALWIVAPPGWSPPSSLRGAEAVARGRHAQLLRRAGRPAQACP